MRLEAGTGTDLGMQGAMLGMETPAGPRAVPVEQGGHPRGKMCWFKIRRCCGCAVPQCEPCTPAGSVPTCKGCALWRSWGPCCPSAQYILGAPRVAVLCRPRMLRNGPECSRQAVVSLLTAAVLTMLSDAVRNKGCAQLLALFPSLCLSFSAGAGAGLCPPSAGHGGLSACPRSPSGVAMDSIPANLSPPRL